jgi:hypothetical protein
MRVFQLLYPNTIQIMKVTLLPKASEQTFEESRFSCTAGYTSLEFLGRIWPFKKLYRIPKIKIPLIRACKKILQILLLVFYKRPICLLTTFSGCAADEVYGVVSCMCVFLLVSNV